MLFVYILKCQRHAEHLKFAWHWCHPVFLQVHFNGGLSSLTRFILSPGARIKHLLFHVFTLNIKHFTHYHVSISKTLSVTSSTNKTRSLSNIFRDFPDHTCGEHSTIFAASQSGWYHISILELWLWARYHAGVSIDHRFASAVLCV